MQQHSTKVQPAKEEDLFKQLLHKYLPYWPLYLILILLFLGLAVAYSKFALPVYEAYSSVVIKDESKGLNESEMMQELNLFRGKKIVDNEIEILKSHSFISDVVTNLGLYADIQEQGRFRKVPAYTSSPIKVKFNDPGVIKKREIVPFQFDRDKREVVIGKDRFPINAWVATKWGKISFLPNYQFSGDTTSKEFFIEIVPPQVVEAGLMKALKVVPASKLSTVINLSIKDHTPQRAKDILNDLVRAYTQAEIEDKNMRAANTVAMVENRIRNVAGQLDSVENEIQRFRRTSGVIDISSQGKQYLESVGQYDREVEQIKNQLAILNEVEKFLVSKDANNAIVPSALGVNDPMLNQMLDKLNDYQMQYEKLRRTTGENSPVLVSVRDQIEQLRPGILENIRNQKITLNITRNNYASTGSRYSAMLSSIPQKEKQLIEISRQQSIKNQLYGFLLEKREEAALSYSSSNIGDTRIIDKAFSSVMPVSPNQLLLYLAAIVFGIGAGIVYVSLKEALNTRVLFRSEITKTSGIPIVGEILQGSSREQLVMGKEDHKPVGKQLKSLRNSLFFTNDGTAVKSLLVTSASKGEGKSFIASNLALSLANANAKVVLVDLDFYKSKVTEQFNLAESKGLSDCLSGKTSLDTVLYPYADQQSLHILPAGLSIGDRKSEVLISQDFNQLMTTLKGKYEYIVLAGPSFHDDVNIQTISQVVDGTLFIIRQGTSRKSDLTMLQADKKLQALKHPKFVFNGVGGRGWGIKMFGNGYGYGNTARK